MIKKIEEIKVRVRIENISNGLWIEYSYQGKEKIVKILNALNQLNLDIVARDDFS